MNEKQTSPTSNEMRDYFKEVSLNENPSGVMPNGTSVKDYWDGATDFEIAAMYKRVANHAEY